MNSEKRLFLAIGLSVLVILGYQAYMKKYAKPYHLDKQNDTVAEQAIEAPQNAPIPQQAPAVEQKTKPQLPENTISITTDVYKAIFTDRNAAIKELILLQYEDDNKEPVFLSDSREKIPELFSMRITDRPVTNSWRLVEDTKNTIVYKNKTETLNITKAFTFYNDKYIIGLELIFRNTADAAQQISYILDNGASKAGEGYLDSRYVGADVQIGSKVFRKRPSGKTLSGGLTLSGSPAWLSTHDRYFSFVLKPEQNEAGALIQSSTKKDIWSAVSSGAIQIAPGESVSRRYMLYAGPSDAKSIAELGSSANNVISYGIFHSIAQILFKGLKLFYNITGNYGVAIILLSLVIGLIMMPLTRKSLHSMKEMQKIQPETEQIRKAHSNNPQKMNKEIMELYKKHKINPVGGCLPMLLQLPIFMSLYQVLLRSVALRNAGFLWIKNLAGPDAAFTIPQRLPIIGNNINILPILMAIAMWLQQKVSHGGGKEASDQQKMMSKIMPVMFGFIFYNMPSGLVLYWLTNTLFMLVVQEVVLKARYAGTT